MQRGEGGFRLGAAWVHFGFPPHGAALSTEDGCWRCELEAPGPSGAHLPGHRAWERGRIQPIRCTCPEPLGQSDAPVPTFPANLMHRPATSQPIRCICRVLFGQSVCPDPGPPAGVRAGTSGTGARVPVHGLLPCPVLQLWLHSFGATRPCLLTMSRASLYFSNKRLLCSHPSASVFLPAYA